MKQVLQMGAKVSWQPQSLYKFVTFHRKNDDGAAFGSVSAVMLMCNELMQAASYSQLETNWAEKV